MSPIYYFLTFTEGILTFISPCLLPMLPIYFIYLAGETEQNVNSKSKLFINSIGFVIGFSLIFTLLGASATTLGHFLSNHRSLLEKISGAVMIVFGLNFIGILKIGIINMDKRINYQFKSLKFITSVIFGIVFAFGWSPCLSSFLGSALALASNSKTIFEGILLLLCFSIGLGIPFILTSIIFEKVKGAFKKIQEHSRTINIVSGALLIIAGVLVFTGSLKYFNFFGT
ncbi:cytochrome c biogenesis CcdA family protein [Ruminiclostridium papyrosolvens DSM 2782]|uniref:cytochrome c biogenesis CcdA family protein n=1 Tax=Ruminiclostridium papyrosolvens TaxID=29362 RepID=UPI0023E3BEFB|nr:cytochrome c biogenesis CcdA family protein [Ruminiclostridium papyrosolvens]WES36613.1 cytochrome c biogenesis CcdA family protein [Ruminiclostridium papyrosolvens DSM 2782]